MARAAIASLGRNVALSHVTGAVENGLRTYGVDLSKVHVTRLDGGAGRTEAGVVHHEGFSLDGDVIEKDGLLVMAPARAALETAGMQSTSIESGLVTLDSVLHLGLADEEQIAAMAALMEHWPFTRGLTIVVRLADGRAQSVGESRSRFMCWSTGLPAPELQFDVYDAAGRLVGTTDFAWPEHKLLGEFDGMVKYGRLVKPGETPFDVVTREKEREDALREITLWAMIRLVWADLETPQQTAARIRRLMSVAA